MRTVHYDGYTGKIQLVAGGPPCQPFSLGGKQQAYNDKRDMFPEAVRAVREVRPKVFIFENVRGLLRKSFGEYFNYILLQLQHPEIIKGVDMTWLDHLALLEKHHTAGTEDGLSYNVVFRRLNAADYGAPQIRQRVIIVGFRCDYNASWAFPEPSHSQEALLYSKWISRGYWDEHHLKMPTVIPLTKAKLTAVQKAVEVKRINDHAKSIDAATNLNLADFRCRFLAVDDIWIPLAESMVIERFNPVCNCLLEGFGNHAPGRGRSSMMTPSWDWFHPGRAWAANLQPFTKSKEQLDAEIREYLQNALL